MNKTVVALLIILAISGMGVLQRPIKEVDYTKPPQPTSPQYKPFSFDESAWADSVFNTLTLEQKIGQCFMVATFSDRNESYYKHYDHLIEHHHIGGLIFFKGTPQAQARLTNRYQALSKVPLMIGIDGEWGLGMRLGDVDDFPKQMTLGAIEDNTLIEDMGREIARQCRLIGVNINFAPVADINSNPRNPIIGMRSFGEERENVTRKAAAYMRGMQSEGVIATAKHFPGHGDTDSDSHYTLPVLSQSSDHLEEINLYPFQRLIADSLLGVITGHLYAPVLDNTPFLAASLSSKVVTDLLKKRMGFQGLVFTDALNMQGVKKGRTATDVNIKALLAGNDILLYPENVAESIRKIKIEIEKGTIPLQIIDEKVKKILKAKYWLGLNQFKPINLQNLDQQLQTSHTKTINRQLCEQAVTLVHNPKNLLPIQAIDTITFASLALGEGGINLFQQTLSQYAPFKHIVYAERPISTVEVERLIEQVGDAKVVIVSLHDNRRNFNRPFVIPSATIDLLNRLEEKSRVIVHLFASPYSLKQLPKTSAVVCAYENLPDLQVVAAQQVFGALPYKGRLPVSIEGLYPIRTGQQVPALRRLAFGTPQQVRLNAERLGQIDTLILRAITNKVFPGCQVLVARHGRVV
ncbi:MAG: glycoside hydrolase family 3 protein, partial [Runella sp.]